MFLWIKSWSITIVPLSKALKRSFFHVHDRFVRKLFQIKPLDLIYIHKTSDKHMLFEH